MQNIQTKEAERPQKRREISPISNGVSLISQAIVYLTDHDPSLPHVETVDDGMRNVDIKYDFQSHEEIDAFLQQCTVIGIGRNAIALSNNREEETVVRIEIVNPAGYEWTVKFLDTLLLTAKANQQEKLLFLKKKVEEMGKEHYHHRIKDARRKFRKRIAAHNSQFRRDPSSTIPINSYYAFNKEPFAQRMKHLKGKSLAEIDPEAIPAEEHILILQDTNPANVIMEITNSQFATQVIDLCMFTPSNRDLTMYYEKDSD